MGLWDAYGAADIVQGIYWARKAAQAGINAAESVSAVSSSIKKGGDINQALQTDISVLEDTTKALDEIRIMLNKADAQAKFDSVRAKINNDNLYYTLLNDLRVLKDQTPESLSKTVHKLDELSPEELTAVQKNVRSCDP